MREPDKTCENCRFWIEKDIGNFYNGECRRMPPQLTAADAYMARFPYTKPADWCGEFRIKR